jgi:hypothetical protein
MRILEAGFDIEKKRNIVERAYNIKEIYDTMDSLEYINKKTRINAPVPNTR